MAMTVTCVHRWDALYHTRHVNQLRIESWLKHAQCFLPFWAMCAAKISLADPQPTSPDQLNNAICCKMTVTLSSTGCIGWISPWSNTFSMHHSSAVIAFLHVQPRCMTCILWPHSSYISMVVPNPLSFATGELVLKFMSLFLKPKSSISNVYQSISNLCLPSTACGETCPNRDTTAMPRKRPVLLWHQQPCTQLPQGAQALHNTAACADGKLLCWQWICAHDQTFYSQTVTSVWFEGFQPKGGCFLPLDSAV